MHYTPQAILEHPYWLAPGHRPRDDRKRKEDLPGEGTMTMTEHSEQLPRPAGELDDLAGYYDTHDTSAEMEHGEWVEPQPMATTSLRLPADVIDELKRQARARHLRYTSYVRSILERAARGGPPAEIADIAERLDRIERAVTSRGPDDKKQPDYLRAHPAPEVRKPHVREQP
jgi:hypothetical protein